MATAWIELPHTPISSNPGSADPFRTFQLHRQSAPGEAVPRPVNWAAVRKQAQRPARLPMPRLGSLPSHDARS